MSQAPPLPPSPGSSYSLPAQPRKTSVAAVLSLVCGILGCFIVTGILAVILGIVGLRKTRDPQVSGRGLAIAGIILGVLTMLPTVIGLATGGLAFWGVAKMTEEPRRAAREWMVALSAGDVDKAASLSTAGVTRERLAEASETVKAKVAFVDMTSNNINIVNQQGDLTGTADFANGKVGYQLSIRQENGQWKVERFTLSP